MFKKQLADFILLPYVLVKQMFTDMSVFPNKNLQHKLKKTKQNVNIKICTKQILCGSLQLVQI